MLKLTKTAARDYINAHPEIILERDKDGKGFVCPFCNNGSGSDGDGLRLNKKDPSGTHYKCFKCGYYGDVLDMIAQMNSADCSSAEVFAKARELYSIELIPDIATHPTSKLAEQLTKELEDEIRKETEEAEREEAIRSYLRACRADGELGRAYLESRGISFATAAKHWLGYDKSKSAIVIPALSNNKISYVIRYTSSNMRARYQNAEGVSVGFFNYKGISSKEPLFVVEGAFDALSILELGFNALALNSGSNADRFIKLVNERKDNSDFPTKILIAMDNDEAGRGYAETLSDGLQEASVAFEVVDIAGGYKDANELLQRNRERLRANLNRAVNPELAEVVDAHKVGSLLAGFKAYIKDGANNHSIPTGFGNFDKAIGGGLFPKLYMIGAISSLGKTTFVLQCADMIAQAGHDVIIFSLEMSKEDIIARSVSRHTYIISEERNNERLAKTELGIVAYERYANYSDEEKAVIGEAVANYSKYADEHISIYEGKHTAAQIRSTVDSYIKYTGKKPVVFVDYLQIVQPSEQLRRATVREQVDDTIEAFTAMRRELKIPVVVVSSFNRSSYNTVADNTAFKESGTIEYSADCTITLELDVKRNDRAGAGKDANGAKTDTLEAMRGTDGKREIKLTFQKNRGNRVGSVVYFVYDPRFNHFREDENKAAKL